MTPNFREIAEKIVEDWISPDKVYVGTFYGNLIGNIEAALRQVYEQRPKVEISFPTLEEVMSSYGTGLTAPEWKVGIESCYYYLKANTKIKDVENEKV